MRKRCVRCISAVMVSNTTVCERGEKYNENIIKNTDLIGNFGFIIKSVSRYKSKDSRRKTRPEQANKSALYLREIEGVRGRKQVNMKY